MQTGCDVLLKQLKNIDSSLGDVRLKGVCFLKSQNLVEVTCVSDVAVSPNGVKFLKNNIKKELPSKLNVEVKIEKSIVDADIAKRAVIKYVQDNNHSVSHIVTAENVKVICAGKITKYDVCVPSDMADYFKRLSVIEKIDERLSREFSSDFSGSVRIVNVAEEELPEYVVETVNAADIEKVSARRLKVVAPTRFIDTEDYDTADYIDDAKDRLGPVIFAGYVQSIERHETKNGKPFFVITLDDKTGVVTGRFFTSDKNKIKKMEKIAEGSIIIMRGENEEFNGKTSLVIRGINLCMLPEGYKPDEKPSKPVPKNYVNVFPTAAEIIKQGDIFSTYDGPEKCLLDKEFTVVDIESTGLNVTEDKIIEIGAVKIKNGEVVSQFQVLINPKESISQKSVELTGITDEMVKDCYTLDKVYPDFYKYVSGSVFIAHNADFDYRFLRHAGKELGYKLDCEVIDTVQYARTVIPGMKNYKLNTLCEKFGIQFRHHRALADAFATAELFLELVKIKKSL